MATPFTPAGGTTATPAPTWRKLSDKRVGIIGTGATAIQCVPHLAEAAQHLFVFQRTPSTVDVRANRADRSGVGGGTGAGLAAAAHRELPAAHRRWRGRRGSGRRRVDEHHQEALRDARTATVGTPAKNVAGIELADFAKMEEIRARVDADRRPTPPPPRRSSPGTGTSANGRASTTSTCRRSTGDNVTLVDTHGLRRRADHRVGGGRRRRRSTNSTA